MATNNSTNLKNLTTLSEWMRKNKNIDGIQISGHAKDFIQDLKKFTSEIVDKDRTQRENTQRYDLTEDLLTRVLQHNKIKPLNDNDLSILDLNNNIRVIIEYKRSIQGKENPQIHSNPEMMHPYNLNCKAFQELVSYYLREKTGLYKNKSNQHQEDPYEIIGIVTDGLEWFVFSDEDLKKYFLDNNDLIDIYRTWCGYAPLYDHQISLLTQPNLFKENDKSRTDKLYTKIKYFINLALKKGLKIGYIDISKLT